MRERFLVVGASGHARVVIDILQRMPDRIVVGVVARDQLGLCSFMATVDRFTGVGR